MVSLKVHRYNRTRRTDLDGVGRSPIVRDRQRAPVRGIAPVASRIRPRGNHLAGCLNALKRLYSNCTARGLEITGLIIKGFGKLRTPYVCTLCNHLLICARRDPAEGRRR